MESGKWKMETGRPFSLALWLLPQLFILLLTLFHVPLWLNIPIRMDDLALPAMLAIQILTAALLFGILLCDWGSIITAIVVAWPMIQFAAFVSAVPFEQWALAGAYLSLFLAVLAVWNHALRSQRARLAGAALVAAVTVGGALLAYLRAEYSRQSAPTLDLARTGAWSPLLGVLSQLRSVHILSAWIPLAAALIAGLLVIVFRRRSPAVRHSTPNVADDRRPDIASTT
jgi:hypothetical protein